ncbi:MAG: ATP-grasp domain-containing protein [Alphaproteobacteria bacterium]
MRIAILTTGNEEEDNRLFEAATERGHDVEILNLSQCCLHVCTEFPNVYYNDRAIGGEFDIILPRIDTPHTQYGLTILRQFQSMHVYTSDMAYSLEVGRDKMRCMQRLLREGVPFPSTGIAYSKKDFDEMVDRVGGAPIIVKLVEGTEGVGVFLANDAREAVYLLRTFKQLSTPLIVQKFIEESSGSDIRAFVVGGKVVAAMERISKNGDFRANIALGGQSKSITLTPEEEKVALDATKAIGINIAGVDLIRSNNGPLVIEVNVAPNFGGEWGLEDISGVDVAGAIVDFAVSEQAKM